MHYYNKSVANKQSDYYVIRVTISKDFEAYIRSRPQGTVRYAYATRQAKRFDAMTEAVKWIEKHRLSSKYPLGCAAIFVTSKQSAA